MGWSSFNKAMAVTNCDDFTFATDIDYKYSSYYMYFITTDKSKTQLDIYPSTKHHIKEQTLPIVKTDGKPFMDVEVLIKPHKLTTKKD